MTMHPRQFVLGPKRFSPDDGWRHRVISKYLVLSYETSLTVETVKTSDGVEGVVLGLAVAPGFESVAEHASTLHSSKLIQATAF